MENKWIYSLLLLAIATSSVKSQSVTIKTPNNSNIEVFYRSEMPITQIAEIDAYIRTNYPAAALLRSASTTYNCHSYAWNLSEGGTVTAWMNQNTQNGQANVSKYWSDQSYMETTAFEAEKIFYYAGDHSAVKSSVSNMYESKWGAYSLMRHAPDYGPAIYKMDQRRYYKGGGIIGPDLVPCSGTVTYSLNRNNSVANWTLGSNALEFVGSNQNVHSVTIRAKSTSGGNMDGAVFASVSFSDGTTKTLIKPVYIGAPGVTSVTGPNQGNAGSGIYFYADPIFPSSQGEYEWTVQPSEGVSMSPYRHTNYITFSRPGTYAVGCRSTSPCGKPSSYTTTTISISGYHYSVSVDPSAKTVRITANGIEPDKKVQKASEILTYFLYYPTTGVMKASGTFKRTGGLLHFEGQPAGIYILTLQTADQAMESHKILFK